MHCLWFILRNKGIGLKMFFLQRSSASPTYVLKKKKLTTTLNPGGIWSQDIFWRFFTQPVRQSKKIAEYQLCAGNGRKKLGVHVYKTFFFQNFGQFMILFLPCRRVHTRWTSLLYVTELTNDMSNANVCMYRPSRCRIGELGYWLLSLADLT
jgi:hypothetical protein